MLGISSRSRHSRSQRMKNSLKEIIEDPPRYLSKEFIYAIKVLSNRVDNSRDTPVSYETNRLKFTPPTGLGPGQYFKRSSIDRVKIPTKLTLENFESQRVKTSTPRTSRRKYTSPKEHNQFVKDKQKKRLEIFNENNIRNRDRFKTIMQTQKDDFKKEYIKELMSLFTPFVMVYGISSMISQKIIKKSVKYIQDIRKNSTHLFKILFHISRFIGLFNKKLRVIRKKIANKNIDMITNPIIKYVYHKRMELRKLLTRHVKRIRQLNLLFILMHKFLAAIKFIQSTYRRYKLIKNARVQLLYLICLKISFNQNSLWSNSSLSMKHEILSRFLVNQTHTFAKAKSKYFNDSKMINKGFTRNFNYWAGDAMSIAMGRTFIVKLPSPPVFKLFALKSQLIYFINSIEYKPRKRKKMKSSAGFADRSYY
ncbi:hypothetical protein SteCoe_23848 [Stentor coeruleus]|uniref:Uncharacterized protein n=1 Tax=Stentor coeruleus TaxID=5963 RepID=A0A1R2BJ33_9CILI|nr:hypothetical protein SteCoe_23848 [Stentor coeruleus]